MSEVGQRMPNGTTNKGNHGNGRPFRASKERRRLKRGNLPRIPD